MKRFHVSRWRYWWGYSVVLLLVLVAIWFTDRGADSASWMAFGVAAALFIVLEFSIRVDTIVVKDNELEHRLGLLSKNVTKITYDSISNVSVHQTFLERILGYGDVFVDTPGHTPGREYEIVLKGFSRPSKIEKLVSSNLHKLHSQHPHHAVKPHVGP